MKTPLLLCAWLSAAAFAQNKEAIGLITHYAAVAVEAEMKLKDPSLPTTQSGILKLKHSKAILKIIQTGMAHPSDETVNLEAGKSLGALGENEPALNFFSRAIKIAQESKKQKVLGEALTARARLHQKSGNFPSAAADAHAALQLDRENKTAANIFNLSDGRKAKIAPAAPAKSSGGAAKTAPGQKPAAPVEEPPEEFMDPAARAAALAGKAQSSSAAGDHEGALHLADQAVELQPGTARFHLVAAKVKLAAADYEGALENAMEAVALDPKSDEAFLVRARVKEARGFSVAEVLADYKALAERDKTYALEYKNAMARYRRAGSVLGGASMDSTRGTGPQETEQVKELTSRFVKKTTRMIYWALFIVVGIPILLASIWWFTRRRDESRREN